MSFTTNLPQCLWLQVKAVMDARGQLPSEFLRRAILTHAGFKADGTPRKKREKKGEELDVKHHVP